MQYLLLSEYGIGSPGDKWNKGEIMTAGRPSFFSISISSGSHHAHTAEAAVRTGVPCGFGFPDSHD